MKVGFCGTGLMGTPMVRRLLKAGHEVLITDIDRNKLAPLVALGAQTRPHSAQLAAETECVFLSVMDAKVVGDVVFGANGVATVRGARCLVDHSSIPPAITRDYAQRLTAANGMQWIDAPVSGGSTGAEAGTLTVMAGGDAAILAAMAPVIRSYAAHVNHMGPVGAGQATKLCNQTIVASTLLSIAEAVVLAEKNDIDPLRMMEALAGGWADSKMLQTFVPRMVQMPSATIGAVSTLLKDVDTVLDAAKASQVAMPVTAATQQMLRMAAALGLGAEDLSVIARLYRSNPRRSTS
jgi:3-hydroxyisobutyrate dehydrogenase-like beta-hydroxyacid dehydrogenase